MKKTSAGGMPTEVAEGIWIKKSGLLSGYFRRGWVFGGSGLKATTTSTNFEKVSCWFQSVLLKRFP